jgi:hypothetical protein
MQLFCITICDSCSVISHVKCVLYFYVSTLRSMCAVPNMAVFCCGLISCFPGLLLRRFLNDFEMVPVAPFFTGISFTFAFYVTEFLL